MKLLSLDSETISSKNDFISNEVDILLLIADLCVEV